MLNKIDHCIERNTMKKNIIISVFDMEIGGIERSLINMLESFNYDQYNVDLLVFDHRGDFMSLIPNEVNILPQIDQYTVFRKPITQCIKEGHYATSIIRVLSKYVANIKAKSRKFRRRIRIYSNAACVKIFILFHAKANEKI